MQEYRWFHFCNYTRYIFMTYEFDIMFGVKRSDDIIQMLIKEAIR